MGSEKCEKPGEELLHVELFYIRELSARQKRTLGAVGLQ